MLAFLSAAIVRPDVEVIVQDSKNGWLKIFEGEQSPLGQCFLKGLSEYEVTRSPVAFPACLGQATTRRKRAQDQDTIMAFRALLDDPKEVRYLRDYLQGMLLPKHRALVDCGPDQAQPIARGELLPTNIIPSSENKLRLFAAALHAGDDGSTLLTVVGTDGKRSYSCDGLAPPFIRVLEELLRHVKCAVVVLILCGGWVRYRDELADLARRNQLIFVLTGQSNVYHLDHTDPVPSSQLRLAAALLPRLVQMTSSKKTITATALREMVFHIARPIHQDAARTTLAEVLDHHGVYTSLAAVSTSSTPPSMGAPAAIPLLLETLPTTTAPVRPSASATDAVIHHPLLNFTIPKPREVDTADSTSVYCSDMKGRRFLSVKRQQVQVSSRSEEKAARASKFLVARSYPSSLLALLCSVSSLWTSGRFVCDHGCWLQLPDPSASCDQFSLPCLSNRG